MKTILKASLVFLISCLLSFSVHAKDKEKYEQEFYFGSPYITNPLGEGEGDPYSPRPLVRYDGFDCVTYLEMLLATKRYAEEKDKTSHDFMYWHNLIRYMDGEIGFFTRAHIVELHWIRNALKHGFIEEYPMDNVQYSNYKFDLKSWFLAHLLIDNKDANYIAKANEKSDDMQASLPFLPRAYITKEFIDSLNSPKLVLIIKEFEKSYYEGQMKTYSPKVEVTTHMGLVIDGEFYHASSKQGKVVKESLYDYVSKNPSIKGIALYNANI